MLESLTLDPLPPGPVRPTPTATAAPTLTPHPSVPHGIPLKLLNGYVVPATAMVDELPLARKYPNLDGRDLPICFEEESHKYYLRGVQMDTSVTSVPKALEPEFETQKSIHSMLNNPQFPMNDNHEPMRHMVMWVDPGFVDQGIAPQLAAGGRRQRGQGKPIRTSLIPWRTMRTRKTHPSSMTIRPTPRGARGKSCAPICPTSTASSKTVGSRINSRRVPRGPSCTSVRSTCATTGSRSSGGC